MDKQSKTLNALRMGVIPDNRISEFIVGKDQEQDMVHEFLKDVGSGQGVMKFFRGPYGSGKTFMLSYLSEMAIEQNFVVASVPIHSGFGFSKLEGIYQNIMANLIVKQGDGRGSSFESIFDYWIKDLRSGEDMALATKNIYRVITELNNYNSSFASVLLIYIRAKINHDYELSKVAASWIKGDRNMSYELKKQLKVKGSVDRENALDIFTGFIRLIHLMGYKGLIVTFDEAEMIMQQRADIRLKAYSNLRQMIDMAGGGTIDHCGFIFAGTDAFFEDEEKGVKSYQALYQRLGTLIHSSSSVTNVRQPIIKLRPFTKDDYVLLTQKVVALHEQVRGYKYDSQIAYLVNLTMLECGKQSQGESLSVRIFLKKLIELLDLMYDNPDLPVFRALKSRSN